MCHFMNNMKLGFKKKFEMDVDKVSVQNKKVLPQNCEKNIPETLIKVSQKGNIIETRREITKMEH